jgi:hypothetical protein
MADDVLEDAGPSPDAGKVKREPPTIDLEATKVSEAAKASDKASDKPADASTGPSQSEPPKESVKSAEESRRPISPWLTAPVSGVIGAAIVIAVSWVAGWPSQQTPPAAPQVGVMAFEELGKRVTELESKAARPSAPVTDSAATARLDTLEKSQGTLRSDLANLRAQADRLAAAASSPKAAPSDSATASPAPTVDLSAITARIDQLEKEARTQDAAIAKIGEKPPVPAKAADDVPLRRIIAAALLDVAVRHGDHFVRPLATAKALASDPAVLKPLDDFADKGVPNPQAMCRELLTLVPKLSPAPEATTGSGIVDRLQAGASKLVRVERTDSVGNDRSAVVTRVTAAALRNDYAEARRELASLSAEDRAPAQAWLDKAAARDAALAASRQFAEETMAALAKSAQ